MRSLSIIVCVSLLSVASVRAALAEPAKAAVAPSPKAQKSPAERPGMVYIPAGEFLMGSSDNDTRTYDHEKNSERPQHRVKLKAYYIDKYEVTQKDFDAYKPGRTRDERSPCDTCPATKLAWFDATKYCESKGKRLPTEAEWEKAAKGGLDAYYPDPFGDYAVFNRNSIQNTQPVGSKKPNGYGLYDMLGNVREWTNDWYDVDYYKTSPKEDPKGPEKGTRKVERGGAFFLPQNGVTATIRYNHPPPFTLYFLGFRCAQDL